MPEQRFALGEVLLFVATAFLFGVLVGVVLADFRNYVP